jgi:hypothetical protein
LPARVFGPARPIATKSVPSIVFGYTVETLFGVTAERRSLEDIARPLSAVAH